jgi:hypothetical protein
MDQPAARSEKSPAGSTSGHHRNGNGKEKDEAAGWFAASSCTSGSPLLHAAVREGKDWQEQSRSAGEMPLRFSIAAGPD